MGAMCWVCHARLTQDDGLCQACEAALLVRPRSCRRCGAVLYEGACLPCLETASPFDFCWSAFQHEGFVRDALLAWKHRQHHGQGALVQRLFAQQLKRCDPLESIDRVVPVPSSPKAWLQRGFNPAACLALKVAEHFKAPCSSDHVRHTGIWQRQAQRNRQERLLCPQGVFVPAPGAGWQGEHVVVVDDVLSTGATLRRMVQVARWLGARRVGVITLSNSGP